VRRFPLSCGAEAAAVAESWGAALEAGAPQRRRNAMKVGLIGAGEVGRACLLSLVMEGSAGEIVLVNRTPERARGMITDLRYGAALAGDTRLTAGGYDDLAGASLVIVTAGVNEK